MGEYKILDTSTVKNGYRITIKKKIRDILDIDIDDTIVFCSIDDDIVIKKV